MSNARFFGDSQIDIDISGGATATSVDLSAWLYDAANPDDWDSSPGTLSLLFAEPPSTNQPITYAGGSGRLVTDHGEIASPFTQAHVT